MTQPPPSPPPAGTVSQLSPPRRTLTATLRSWLLGAALLVLFLVAAVFLTGAFTSRLGPQVVALATLAAVLPLGIVVPTFLWLDRYEAEPRRYLLFAFGWGALIATTVSLVLNTGSLLVLSQVTYDGEALAAVVVAPVVEESLKGLGVLLLLLRRREEFDGILDGIVYAGLCATGFAFAENVLYLGQAFAEQGSEGMVAVFVLRCLLGPFAHPLFTCCTGVGIGLAAMSRSRAAEVLGPFIGFVCAVALHALWNVSAVLGLEGFFNRYLVLQLPIFLLAIAFVLWERRREGRVIGSYLAPYVSAGWLTAPEAQMLSNLRARSAARSWAKNTGGATGRAAMRAFQDNASELALLRRRIETGHAAQDAYAVEWALVERMSAARRQLLALSARTPTGPVVRTGAPG